MDQCTVQCSADPDFRPLVLFFVQNVMSSHLLPHLNFWLPSYKYLCVFDKAYLEPGLSVGLQGGRGQLFALRDDQEGWGAPGAKDSYRPIYPQPSLPFQNNMWQNRQQIQQTQQYQLWTFAYKFMFKSRLSLWHSGNITKEQTRELMFQEKIWKCSSTMWMLHSSNPTNKCNHFFAIFW